MFFAQHFQPGNMITMLMTDEDGFDLFHVQLQPFHPLFCFSAAETGINQYSFFIIANVITIGIAAAVE